MLKRRSFWMFTLLSIGALQFAHGRIANGEELSEARFRELHKQLQPGDEPWRTIPWKIDLLDAQREAAKLRKPIFIWAMDGHPLGCT